jgi:WXG100 family type VII secretion target
VIKADDNAFTQLVAKLTAHKADLTTIYDDLDSSVHTLARQWSGQARESFLDAYDNLKHAIDHAQTVLDDNIKLVRHSHEKLAAAEQICESYWAVSC